MIELRIAHTGKGYGRGSKWQLFDESRKAFDSLADAKRWIRETYGKSKRQAQYTEREDGTSYRSGWVIGFRNSDWSHSPVEKWLQQDWITVVEVTPKVLA